MAGTHTDRSLGSFCFVIDAKIVVNQNMTHADYFRPWYVWRESAYFFRQESGRFTDDLEVSDEPVLKKFISFECLAAARGISLNVSDGVEDVVQSLAGLSHNGIASFRTRSR